MEDPKSSKKRILNKNIYNKNNCYKKNSETAEKNETDDQGHKRKIHSKEVPKLAEGSSSIKNQQISMLKSSYVKLKVFIEQVLLAKLLSMKMISKVLT